MRAITEADPTLSKNLEGRGYRVTINKSHKCEHRFFYHGNKKWRCWSGTAERSDCMVNSRQKGARFERDLAKALREYGYDCRRGQQYCGANGDADVIGLPGIHIEAKAVERLNLYEAVEQAKRDTRKDEIPAVFHKKNYQEILVTIPFPEFMKLYKEAKT